MLIQKFQIVSQCASRILACRYASTKQVSQSSYCMDLVQKSDHERYLSLLLLPSSETKTSAFALAAFNVQVAQVFDQTSDRTITQMRLQFWRDTLNSVYRDQAPEQPVAQELERAVKRHSLSKHWLKRLIDGRQGFLENRAFSHVEDVEAYAENTVSSFYYLLLEVIGLKHVNADHAASHIGKAEGIVTMLRAVPFHGNKGRVYLPTSVLMSHQVSEQEVIRGSRDQKLKDVVYELASSAHGHLSKARTLQNNVSKSTNCVFLNTVNLDRYLDLLQKSDFDVFDSRLRQRNHMLPFHLLMRKWKGGY